MAPLVKMINRLGQYGAIQHAVSDKSICQRNDERNTIELLNSIAFTSHREEYTAIEYFLHLWRHLKMNFELKFHF